MSGLSKNTKSIRKTDLGTQRNSVLGSKRVLIAHRANAGDTTIDLSNLVFPTAEYAGTDVTGNPSYNEILKLSLAVNSKNVNIKSSLNNDIMKMHYVVISSSLIQFKNDYEASENEIFEIWFEPSIISGATLVDAQPLVQTKVLEEGVFDIVTDVFDYNKFPTKQVGAVMVFRQMEVDGPMALMFRNINNESTGEGNYYEVPSTDGVTNAIRFNNSGGVGGDNVIVVSVGSLVERPTTSMMAFVERINGDVDTLRETVAALAGVDKSNFEDAPHSIDLATFGQRVIELEKIMNVEVQGTPTESYMGGNHTVDSGTALVFANESINLNKLVSKDNSSYAAFTVLEDCDIAGQFTCYRTAAANTADRQTIIAYSGSGIIDSTQGFNSRGYESWTQNVSFVIKAKAGDTFRPYFAGGTPQTTSGSFTFIATSKLRKIKDLI